MNALSVQQPWAWALFHGKPVENRDWSANEAFGRGKPVRGNILIHTGKKVDKDAFVWIETTFGLTIPLNLPTGGIIGRVNLYDCVEEYDSPWFFGKFGFLFKDQKELSFMPCCGQLGFFEVDYKLPL
ncbi:MAG: hypothetical protein WC449_06065 [Candidatus Paceibacterota bacterium]